MKKEGLKKYKNRVDKYRKYKYTCTSTDSTSIFFCKGALCAS